MLLKEKAPYEAESAKAKTEYEKQMKIYDKKQVGISISNLLMRGRMCWLVICSLRLLLTSFFFSSFYSLQSAPDDGDEESERSRSEVHDEDDEASGEVVLYMLLFVGFTSVLLSSHGNAFSFSYEKHITRLQVA